MKVKCEPLIDISELIPLSYLIQLYYNFDYYFNKGKLDFPPKPYLKWRSEEQS